MDEPFSMIPNRIIRSEKLSPQDKAVYGVIASCGREAYPSHEQIATWAGMSLRQAYISIENLVRTGAMERVRDGRHNRYRVFTRAETEDFTRAKQDRAAQRDMHHMHVRCVETCTICMSDMHHMHVRCVETCTICTLIRKKQKKEKPKKEKSAEVDIFGRVPEAIAKRRVRKIIDLGVSGTATPDELERLDQGLLNPPTPDELAWLATQQPQDMDQDTGSDEVGGADP